MILKAEVSGEFFETSAVCLSRFYLLWVYSRRVLLEPVYPGSSCPAWVVLHPGEICFGDNGALRRYLKPVVFCFAAAPFPLLYC